MLSFDISRQTATWFILFRVRGHLQKHITNIQRQQFRTFKTKFIINIKTSVIFYTRNAHNHIYKVIKYFNSLPEEL